MKTDFNEMYDVLYILFIYAECLQRVWFFFAKMKLTSTFLLTK